MRVLHIGKFYAPQRGGIERTTQDLAEWLVRKDVDVAALVHQPRGDWRSKTEIIDGVEVVRVGCIAAPLYSPISPTLPLQLNRLLRRFRPDVLHLHLPNPSCFAVLLNRRARAIPWIVHWHADIPADTPDWKLRAAYRLYRLFEQALLKRAAAIIVTSQRYRDASAALAPWVAKTRVISLGVDAAPIPVAAAPEWPTHGDFRLLAVGRLSYYKGFAILIAALAKLPQASLLLVGHGELLEALRKTAVEHGVAERVRFLGDLDDAGLLAAYNRADGFVLPSLDRGEAFGLVLLEAMRAGLPIVASAIPGSGVGHVVADEISGLLVPPGDAAALAAALLRLIADTELCQRLGKAGQRRWQEEFTLERMARATLALYHDVLGADDS
ncbi:MAG: glycosyltransferase [Dokdonella sp.]